MGQSKKVEREKAERVQSQLGGHSKFDPRDHWCREFYSMKELHSVMARLNTVWSWGAHNYTNIENYAFRFKVQGHLFKGLVYITVNGADLFDIFYVTTKGIVKFYDKDVYVDDLIPTIDGRVERIKEYVR